jgi:hypothetical protein
MPDEPIDRSPFELVRSGEYEKALPYFQQRCGADAMAPDHLNLGTLYLLMHDYGLAFRAISDAVNMTTPRFRADSDYLDLGTCRWCTGQYSAAIDLFRQALNAPYRDAAGGVSAPSLLLYAAERIDSSVLRKEAVTLLRKHARRKLRGWPGPVVPFLLGKLDSAGLDRLAQSSPPLAFRQQCQADFYVALRALREGDTATFATRMTRAASDKSAYLETEYYLARWEVENGFQPPSAVE